MLGQESSRAAYKTAQPRVAVLLKPDPRSVNAEFGAIDTKGWLSYSPVKSDITQTSPHEVPNEK